MNENERRKLKLEAKTYPWNYCEKCNNSWHEDDGISCTCTHPNNTNKMLDKIIKQLEEEWNNIEKH